MGTDPVLSQSIRTRLCYIWSAKPIASYITNCTIFRNGDGRPFLCSRVLFNTHCWLDFQQVRSCLHEKKVRSPHFPQVKQSLPEEAATLDFDASHKTSSDDAPKYEGSNSAHAAQSTAVKVDSRTEPDDGLQKMTVVRLRQLLKSHKLRSTGKKTELVSRLRQHLSR